MKTLGYKFPQFVGGDNPELQNVVRAIEDLRKLLITVINFNAITLTSSGSQPTPAEGAMLMWEDTGATTGQPTHYIVATFGGNTVTFASEEVAP